MTRRQVTILDYGCGNIGSLENMFRLIGANPQVVSRPKDIPRSAAIVLPGVGHFAHAASNLETAGFARAVVEQAYNGVPLLGICVGMQLLLEHSEEGDVAGLGLIKGRVRHFDRDRFVERLPLPNVGWRYAEPADERGAKLLYNMPRRPRFYYVHSYHAECTDPGDEILASEYGYRFTGAVVHDNVTGFQFHPEKSHVYGMTILANWMDLINE